MGIVAAFMLPAAAAGQLIKVKDITNIAKLERFLLRKAERSFTTGKYNYALQYYLELYNIDTTNIEYCYTTALCYLNGSGAMQKSKALYYLTKYPQVMRLDRDAYYHLGMAYQYSHKFEEAVGAYQSFLEGIEQDQKRKIRDLKKNNILGNEARRRIEMCEYAIYLVENPVTIEMINLGGEVNTYYGDYVPVITADESTLIFTSRRKGTTGNKQTDLNEYYEDIYISQAVPGGWSRAVKIDSLQFSNTPVNFHSDLEEEAALINTSGQDAAIGLSADGQKLFLYRSDGRGSGDIFLCQLLGTEWSKPIKLDKTINSKYWEGHVSLSGDENELFFSSNRPGGFGGKDIYKSTRIPGRGWGQPVNLGPVINTPYDEDAPFIHPDGRTLYFSSQGHKSMGGYDIFLSTRTDEGHWTDVVNIGYPLNTADDDIYFVLAGSGERGYVSSDRDGGFGHQDIYRVLMPDYFYEKTVLTLMKGIVKACENPVEAVITIKDNLTGKVQGVYKSNPATGKYVIAIPSGANYSMIIESEGYFFETESIFFPAQDSFIQIIKDIDLLCGELGDRICMNNIFFPVGKAKLLPQSYPELDNLYRFMLENPALIIQIKGFLLTEFGYLDETIAKKRSEAVIDHLVTLGIERERMVADGEALDSVSVNLDLNNKICIEMVGGYLGKKAPLKKSVVPDDDDYKDVLLHCGDRIINNVAYRIQIGAFRDPSQVNFNFMGSVDKVNREILQDGITRFTMGSFNLLADAEDVRRSVIKEGISDAWVVPYYKNRRITMREVRDMCKGDVILVLNGRVASRESGKAIFNAKVLLKNKTVRSTKELFTGPDGSFQFVLPADAEFDLIALKPDYTPDTIPISTLGITKSENVSVTLELGEEAAPMGTRKLKSLTFSGRVIDRETRKDITGVKIQLVNLFSNELKQTENFENGNFDFRVDGSTNYSLLFIKEGYFTRSLEVSTFGIITDTMSITCEMVKMEIEKPIELEVIYYDVNKWQLRPEATRELDKLASLLKENPKIRIELGSHTDSRGSDDFNLTLSEKRAETAVKYVISQGIPESRITAKGYGETQPVNHCINDVECTEEQHSQNRRTEFKVIGFVSN